MNISNFYQQKSVTVYLSLLITALLFVYISPPASLENFFSTSSIFRQQTEAFLHGRLVLSERYIDYQQDLALADAGWYQLWGIGVPLLRLPFEILAKIFGFSAFPDRIIFFLLLLIAQYLLTSSLFDFLESYLSNLNRSIFTVLTSVLIFLNSGLIYLWVYRFYIYEEAIATSILFATIELALLLKLAKNQDYRTWYWICAIAAFHPLIKLTGIFYGFSACLAAALILQSKNYKKLLIGSGVFIFGVFFLLTLNYIRFDSFFNFGYSLNISGVPINEYFLKFENIYKTESVFAAIKEVLGLTFLNPVLIDNKNYLIFHNWQAATLRFREFGFNTFNLADLILLIANFFVLYYLDWKKSVSIIIAFCNFVVLIFLIFFLYTPALTSRYIAELALAMQASHFLLILVLYKTRTSSWIINKVLPYSLYFLLFCNSIAHWINANYIGSSGEHVNAQDYVSTVNELTYSNYRQNPVPAESYACGSDKLGLNYNLLDWNQLNCRVGVLTLLFLRDSECIRLVLTGAAIDLMQVRQSIKVKSNLEYLNLRESKLSENRSELVFCGENKRTAVGFRQVNIAWLSPQEVFSKSADVKLEYIGVVK